MIRSRLFAAVSLSLACLSAGAHASDAAFEVWRIDPNEIRAIKAVFGSHATALNISSTKSATGHMLGAAGAVESIFTSLAITNGKIPPTINLQTPDPECDLDVCANQARDLKIDIALKNNFGFGGTNGTLIFKRV